MENNPAYFAQRNTVSRKLNQEAALFSVTAPAGFGKTTAIKNVLKKQQENQPDYTSIAWINITKPFSHHQDFWHCLHSELSSTLCEVDHCKNSVILSSIQHTIAQRYWTKPLQILKQHSFDASNHYLVLDQLEKSQLPEITQDLLAFATCLPPNLKLIVIGRNLVWPESHTTPYCEPVHINAKDLFFTEKDIAALLKASSWNNPPPPEKLMALTGGWPAIVMQWLNHQSDIDHPLMDIPGIENFIKHNVWKNLNNQQRQVLSLAIPFRRVCRKMLLHQGMSAEIKLQDIYHHCGLLLPTQGDYTWYELHPLIKAFIPQKNHTSQRQSGIQWLLDSQQIDDAIELLAAQGEEQQVANLIKQCELDLRRNGQFTQLYRYLTFLPMAQIESDPTLLIAYCWSMPSTKHLIVGHTLVEKLIRLIKTRYPNIAALDLVSATSVTEHSHYAQLMSEALSLEAYHQNISGNSLLAEKLSERALTLTEQAKRPRRSRSYLTLSLAAFTRGETVASIQLLYSTIRHAQHEQDLYILCVALGYLAENCRLCGDLEAARRTVDNTTQWLAQNGFTQQEHVTWKNHAYADTYREMGRLHEAARLLNALQEQQATMDSLQQQACQHYLIDLYISQQNYTAAETHLSHLQYMLYESSVQWSFGRADPAAQQARLRVYQGDTASAALWAEEQLQHPQPLESFLYEARHLILARVLIATGKASQALSMATALFQQTQKHGRLARAIKAKLLESMAREAAGQKQQANRAFDQALSLAEPRQLYQLFRDELPYIERLLQGAIKRQTCPGFCHHILKVSTPDTVSPLENALAPGSIEALTRREHQVLHLIAEGCKNQDIANRLSLSLGTVKTHARNIQRKLGTSNRTQSLSVAKQIGLLGNRL